MNANEQKMKLRGENKVWKTILTKDGAYKSIASTQIGQQLLFEEALGILPQVTDWIHNGSAKSYRKELLAYFENEEIILTKIVQSFLFLAGSIYDDTNQKRDRDKVKRTRHKKIKTLKDRVMPELSFDQTWRFLEVIIDLSRYFDVEKTPSIKDNRFSWSMKYVCNLSEVILGKLAIESAKAFYPMPMTEEPKEWKYEDGEITGGYMDYQYELIRAPQRNIDYSRYSKRVFDAINYIQSVPWKVNVEVLQQVKMDLKPPRKIDYVKTKYPDPAPCQWDIDLKNEDSISSLSPEEIDEIKTIRAQYKEKVALFNADMGDYESALGKFRAAKLAVQVAEQYAEVEEIYFPHSFDFRGRVYPLPIGLSPQGSDAVKALLLYANTEPLTESGIAWNWAYLASLYGDDKITFIDRIERGKELINADYTEADEPYQFLSHQLELKKWLENPDYIPNTRIHLDACNSGSQFTSAITGDKAGCEATNVIPTIIDGNNIRQDAYLLVADKALHLTNELIGAVDDKEYRTTLKFFKGLLEKKGRKICKTPVMVSNYGGTAGGRAEILWNMFRELGVERKWITKKIATQFAKIIGDSIHGVLNGGKAFETYIHMMNNIVAKNNLPITWTTSDGFFVVHVKKKELKAKQVSCTLPGARRATILTKKSYSDDVSPAKMKSAISPNYIHSLDAELLRRTALRMKKQGIIDSDWIHDSFGCHPNHVDLMLDITKEEFLKMMKRKPLHVLDAELRGQVDIENKKLQDALKKVKIPNLRGFNISNGGLDVVRNSEWFFS